MNTGVNNVHIGTGLRTNNKLDLLKFDILFSEISKITPINQNDLF